MSASEFTETSALTRSRMKIAKAVTLSAEGEHGTARHELREAMQLLDAVLDAEQEVHES